MSLVMLKTRSCISLIWKFVIQHHLWLGTIYWGS